MDAGHMSNLSTSRSCHQINNTAIGTAKGTTVVWEFRIFHTSFQNNDKELWSYFNSWGYFLC